MTPNEYYNRRLEVRNVSTSVNETVEPHELEVEAAKERLLEEKQDRQDERERRATHARVVRMKRDIAIAVVSAAGATLISFFMFYSF